MGLAEFDNCDLIFQAAAATALTGHMEIGPMFHPAAVTSFTGHIAINFMFEQQ